MRFLVRPRFNHLVNHISDTACRFPDHGKELDVGLSPGTGFQTLPQLQPIRNMTGARSRDRWYIGHNVKKIVQLEWEGGLLFGIVNPNRKGEMERSSGSFLDATYRLLTRRNSVNITLIFVGAIVGERVLDYGINKLWHYNNMGKHYEDIPVLGQRMGDE